MKQTENTGLNIFDDLPFWSAPFGIKLLEQVPLCMNIKALDIGYGYGFPLLELAQRLGDSCVVYGIDPMESAYQCVLRKIEILQLKNVRPITGVAEKMPFRDQYFDLIVSNNGLNNTQNMHTAFAEVSRVSKKNAHFIFTVNLPETMIEFYSVLKDVLTAIGIANAEERIQQHIASKRKPVEALRGLISANGFSIQSITEEQFHIGFNDGTSLLHHHLIRIGFLPSWTELFPAKNTRNSILLLEKALNKFAAANGGIRLGIPYVCIHCRKN